jgi:hypothetical protein
MRVHVPIAICFLAGLFMLVQFFVPHHLGVVYYEELQAWTRIVIAFTMVLGISSLIRTHWEKIRRRRQDWGYSVVTLVSFIAMVTIGAARGSEKGSPFMWAFDSVFNPLDATMFSLLAFFMASAAYRTFRARTPEATVLLLTAVIVMLGRVPLGDMMVQHGAYGIWAGLLFLCIAWAAFPWCAARFGRGTAWALGVALMLVPVALLVVSAHLRGMPISGATEWIMNTPAVGAKRGILFGVALGSIATSLRIIFGIERSHLGGH